MSNTPILGAPEFVSAQALPEVTGNEQARYLEQGARHFVFKDRDLATPPGSPADGDAYLVASSPTGDWASNVGDIAFYMSTAWEFISPAEGMTAWINDEDLLIGYDGSGWVSLALSGGGYAPGGADVAVADGGTGASTAAAARTNLGAAAQSQTNEGISGLIETPSNKDYRIVVKAPHGGTITETTTISASGTCTATFKINATALGGTANSVSSSEQSQAHAGSNTFSAGDDIVITISANSSCADMSFTIKYTRTLA